MEMQREGRESGKSEGERKKKREEKETGLFFIYKICRCTVYAFSVVESLTGKMHALAIRMI